MLGHISTPLAGLKTTKLGPIKIPVLALVRTKGCGKSQIVNPFQKCYGNHGQKEKFRKFMEVHAMWGGWSQ